MSEHVARPPTFGAAFRYVELHQGARCCPITGACAAKQYGRGMMARDLARCLDPALIAADCGLTLDPWQADLMRSTAPRVLMLCARQVGKSTVAGLIALSTAVTQAGALILLVSPSQRQSGEPHCRSARR